MNVAVVGHTDHDDFYHGLRKIIENWYSTTAWYHVDAFSGKKLPIVIGDEYPVFIDDFVCDDESCYVTGDGLFMSSSTKNKLTGEEIEKLFKRIDTPKEEIVYSISDLKKRIKHSRNPLERKQLERELNKAYKRRRGSRGKASRLY